MGVGWGGSKVLQVVEGWKLIDGADGVGNGRQGCIYFFICLLLFILNVSCIFVVGCMFWFCNCN